MGKNNYHLKNIKEGTKVESYSIKKFKVGAASVVIGASIFFGAGAVAQASESVSNNTVTDESLGTEKKLEVAPKAQAKPVVENTRESLLAALENSEKETLNKVALTKLIEEIDGKFANGKYASKTEESVNQLKAVLEEARTALNNAKTQDELSQAQAKLVTATTKLQTKPEEKKEAPAVDTTNGKDTAGVKATNTEKAVDTNSIVNSGSRDERNGKALDKNNPFRTDTAPSTSTSTDPLAVNEHGVSIINGDFSDTTLGAELPTATSPIASTIVELSKLKGWNAVNSSTNKVLLIWAAKTGNYDTALPGPRTNIAAILSAYNEITAGATPNTEYGPIYQDIDVVPGQEVIVSYRSQSVGQTAGINGAKLIVKDANTDTKIAEDKANYSGYPIGEFSKIVNVPDGVTKLRLQFESISNRSHDEPDSHRTPDGIYPGASISNVRVSSGAYVVPTVTETTFSKTAVSATAQKVTVRIQARLENKGEATSTSPVYSLTIPEGARLASYDRSKIVPTTSGNQLSMRINSVRPKSSQEFWYELELPATKAATFVLNPTVTYQTNGNLISGTTVATTKKEGVMTSPAQTVTVNMYKADLQAEAAKAATLNQSDYTPEAWAAYQAEIAKAQEILNEETNNVAIANRKNQADINAQTLLLQKAKAKLDLAKAAKAEKEAIAADKSLTAAQRTEKEKEVDTKKAEEEAKITAADTVDAVEAAKTAGVTAIEGVHTPGNLDTVKAAAKAAVDAALAEKAKAIEANDKLSDAEKSAAKEEAKAAADEAKKAIDAATDQAGVDAKATEGTEAVAAVNPVGKDKAKAAVDAALAEKDKAIDANDKLSDAEKLAAKEEAKKAADEAKKAIDAAADQAGVDAKEAEGKAEIAKVTPAAAVEVGKSAAKAEIEKVAKAKEAAIDANDKLSEAEKAAAKAQVAAEAKKAIEAIEKATTEADVEAAKEAGKAEIAKVAPETTDYKAKAKAEVEAELAKKLAELENATDLTEAEKAAAKAQVVNKAKEAIEAIQKAATEADVDQAIRNFVYRISAVIREQEEYDLSKLFVNGSVTVKQGESLTDKDVLSKLNLPSGVEIVKVEKPTTSALGTVMAKVTVKLADGSVEEINVPVEVIVSQNHGNEGNGANNGANNTEAKVNKAKLEGAIHQLDELLLKESAKLDAETAKEANVLSADAKKVFANADATQAEVDAMVKRIEDFMAKVAPLTDHANTANDQSAQTPAVVPANNQSAQTTVVAPATTQAAANASQTLSAQANARKAAKELPNTGTVDSTVAMVAAAASALLGLGLAGRRRKEDEEA